MLSTAIWLTLHGRSGSALAPIYTFSSRMVHVCIETADVLQATPLAILPSLNGQYTPLAKALRPSPHLLGSNEF